MSGSDILGLRMAVPPAIYSTEPCDDPDYDWKDQEIVLGIWDDGEVALCKYDEENDRCLSPDGTFDFHAEGRGHPYWYIPLQKIE